jgi:hypothetical protein
VFLTAVQTEKERFTPTEYAYSSNELFGNVSCLIRFGTKLLHMQVYYCKVNYTAGKIIDR